MKFRYPIQMFIIRALATLAILGYILFMMNTARINYSWLLGFALFFIAAVLITMVTPMFTQHEIDTNEIMLGQGMIFKAVFPLSQIEAVDIYSRKPGIFGLFSTRGRIVLASSNKGLVRIKLNHKRRFGMLLLRQADEIIIDLEKPEEFVKLANEYLSTNSE